MIAIGCPVATSSPSLMRTLTMLPGIFAPISRSLSGARHEDRLLGSLGHSRLILNQNLAHETVSTLERKLSVSIFVGVFDFHQFNHENLTLGNLNLTDGPFHNAVEEDVAVHIAEETAFFFHRRKIIFEYLRIQRIADGILIGRFDVKFALSAPP